MTTESARPDPIVAYLMAAVVQPCVDHLHEAHGVDVTGDVVTGHREGGSSTYIGSGDLDDVPADFVYSGRLVIRSQPDESFGGPLARRHMEARLVAQLARSFLDNAADWFCETPVGWGQEVSFADLAPPSAEDWQVAARGALR